MNEHEEENEHDRTLSLITQIVRVRTLRDRLADEKVRYLANRRQTVVGDPQRLLAGQSLREADRAYWAERERLMAVLDIE